MVNAPTLANTEKMLRSVVLLFIPICFPDANVHNIEDNVYKSNFFGFF